MANNNVSVTAVNMESYTENHREVLDADAEVARIDFHVKMRQKNDEIKKEREEVHPPRPMSWEGELSDTEQPDNMCIEVPENLSIQKDVELTKLPGCYSLHSTPGSSPLLSHRHPLPPPVLVSKDYLAKTLSIPATPSPDSAIHSAYSVFSSPNQSPLTQRHVTLTPSLSRNNSDASHSSCYSYSSVSVSVSPTQQFSPTHSPIQARHLPPQLLQGNTHHNVVYRTNNEDFEGCEESEEKNLVHTVQTQPGISRQQLINSPCPICGDKISGFHYGIFSCESCKGFFKRTVQNRKNYVCLRGASCPVTVATRKKCPACRFDKCLQCGMKLEAIREDRTRGGRSTYQCSYSLPPSLAGHTNSSSSTDYRANSISNERLTVKVEAESSGQQPQQQHQQFHKRQNVRHNVPLLLQEIMDVEHLWQYNEFELSKMNSGAETRDVRSLQNHPLLAGTALAGSADANPDFVANLCNIADHRLYKIVKWCKSLPLFKNISIDDQICLLINSWCELLLFSCCFRSMQSPGEIRISLGKSISLAQAKDLGMAACIERMLNFTEQLRRLRVDRYEYVAMKVILLLTSDTSELREAEKVRASQERALKALQDYTLTHYPESPAKFGELLLRIPELQRTCQVGKDMLTIKSKDGEGPSFNLLMELLRGDH